MKDWKFEEAGPEGGSHGVMLDGGGTILFDLFDSEGKQIIAMRDSYAELLAALLDILPLYEKQLRAQGHSDEAIQSGKCGKARAVIAKATNTKPTSDGTLTIPKPVNHEEELAQAAIEHDEWMVQMVQL